MVNFSYQELSKMSFEELEKIAQTHGVKPDINRYRLVENIWSHILEQKIEKIKSQYSDKDIIYQECDEIIDNNLYNYLTIVEKIYCLKLIIKSVDRYIVYHTLWLNSFDKTEYTLDELSDDRIIRKLLRIINRGEFTVNKINDDTEAEDGDD